MKDEPDIIGITAMGLSSVGPVGDFHQNHQSQWIQRRNSCGRTRCYHVSEGSVDKWALMQLYVERERSPSGSCY